jgi:uncharacterized protein
MSPQRNSAAAAEEEDMSQHQGFDAPWRALLACSIVGALLLATPGAGPVAEEARSITVTGEGVTSARPDMAQLTAGATTQAATAGEALAANSQATAAVIERFKAEGIEARDIQTAGFQLQPVYVYPKSEDGAANPPRITGYTVSNSVAVRIRDLARLGAVLDRAVGAGANTINGIEFIVSKQSELLDRARREAVADARRKAELYAAAAGAKLGPVLTIGEQSAMPPPPRPMYRMEAAAAPVPVEVGESQLRVEVSVRFALE